MSKPEDQIPEERRLHAAVSALLLSVTAYQNNATAHELMEQWPEQAEAFMDNYDSLGDDHDEILEIMAEGVATAYNGIVTSAINLMRAYMEYAMKVEGRLPVSTIHATPEGDAAAMPCCGKSPFEVPMTDRMTGDDAQVTCMEAEDVITIENLLSSMNPEMP